MTSNLSEEVRQPIRVPTEIPNEWTWGGLSELCRPKQWPTISKDQLLPDGYVVYGANGPIGFYSEYTHAERTIAITCRGATCGTVNVAPAKSYITGNAMALDDPDRTRVHFDYLYQALVYRGLSDVISGSAQPQIMRQGLAPVLIPLPPLPEQRKIAAILSSVDDAIEATQAVIDQLQVVKKAMMAELLTRGLPGRHTRFKQTEIGEVPEGWEVVTLEAIAASTPNAIVDGPFGSNLKSEHYRASGIPVIQSGFVTTESWRPSEYVYVDESLFLQQRRSAVRGGDIVMAKIGANAGACALMPLNHPEGILAGNSLKITVDSARAKPDYILAVLHFLRERGTLDLIRTTTAQPAISLRALRMLPIPLAPIGEQGEVVAALSSMAQRLTIETQAAHSLAAVKSALSSALLTGEIRVKPDEATP